MPYCLCLGIKQVPYLCLGRFSPRFLTCSIIRELLSIAVVSITMEAMHLLQLFLDRIALANPGCANFVMTCVHIDTKQHNCLR